MAWRPKAWPGGRRQRLGGRPDGLAAERPGGRDGNALRANHAPQSRSRTKAQRRWQIMHRNQVGGWTGLALARRVSAWPMSRRLLPAPALGSGLGSGSCLALALALALLVISRAAQGSPTDRHGRVGQGRTWAAHLWWAKARYFWAHTTHPCGCVRAQCWRGLEPPTARFPLVGAIPAHPALGLTFSRLRRSGHVPLCGRDSC